LIYLSTGVSVDFTILEVVDLLEDEFKESERVNNNRNQRARENFVSSQLSANSELRALARQGRCSVSDEQNELEQKKAER
jgi:hypothetical protein